jgi:hypothetical protein
MMQRRGSQRTKMVHRPLILITGVLAMTAGLAIVNTHNVWMLGWPVIVTLFGWALVIGGAVRIGLFLTFKAYA